jgi:hypothetical protein
MAICLCGCLEIDEQYRISRNGKADARIVFKIDQQYESILLAELDKKLRAALPPEMTVDSTQHIDGKAAIVVEGEQIDLAVLSSIGQPMRLAVLPVGFLKKRYIFSMTAGNAPDFPIPHRLKVSLPGSIDQANGRRMASDTVEFDLTTAHRGESFQAAATAFVLGIGPDVPVVGTTNMNYNFDGAKAARNWILPTMLGAFVLGTVLAVGGWIWKKRSLIIAGQRDLHAFESNSLPRHVSQAPRSHAKFCDGCGAPHSLAQKYCAVCGAFLT